MKYIEIFLILGVVLLFSSCIGVDDKDGMVPEITYFYINNSSYHVTITATANKIPAAVNDSVISVGDTIQFWEYSFGIASTDPFGSPAESTIVKLTFSDTANRCLIFSGPLLTSNDIRSNMYYQDMGIRTNNIIDRCFIITNNDYSKSSLCN